MWRWINVIIYVMLTNNILTEWLVKMQDFAHSNQHKLALGAAVVGTCAIQWTRLLPGSSKHEKRKKILHGSHINTCVKRSLCTTSFESFSVFTNFISKGKFLSISGDKIRRKEEVYEKVHLFHLKFCKPNIVICALYSFFKFRCKFIQHVIYKKFVVETICVNKAMNREITTIPQERNTVKLKTISCKKGWIHTRKQYL